MKKKYILTLLIAILVFSIYTYTREYELKDCMSYDDLSKIVKRDMVVFDEKEDLPTEMLETLADYKVVMTGEVHYIKEYPDFLSKLAIELNKNYDFNTFLIESPQAFNWICEDFTLGVIPELFDGTSDKFFSDFFGLHIIRDYNSKSNKKLNVHAIDLNHSKSYFIWSLKTMLKYVNAPILEELIKDCDEATDSSYPSIINKYKSILKRDYSSYNNGLSKKWYSRIIEMLDVELYSNTCRKYLDANDSELTKKRYIEREEYLKRTIDKYLECLEGRVLINMGSVHLQKTPVLVYDFEWTGQYLYEKSPFTKDDVYCINISYAKGTMKQGEFDYSKSEIENSLPKVMAEYSDGKTGFLPFSDELFSKKQVVFYETTSIEPFTPKTVCDAVIMLPNATFDMRFKNSGIKR